MGNDPQDFWSTPPPVEESTIDDEATRLLTEIHSLERELKGGDYGVSDEACTAMRAIQPSLHDIADDYSMCDEVEDLLEDLNGDYPPCLIIEGRPDR